MELTGSTVDNERHSHLLNTINKVSAILLETKIGRRDENITHSMELMAKAADVDRMCAWKNVTVDGQPCAFQIHEWPEGANLRQGNAFALNIQLSEVTPAWREALSQGKHINGLTCDQPPKEKSYLSSQGVVSILAAPVILNDEFWGFVCFYDCRKERIFSHDEELLLSTFGRLLAGAHIRNDLSRDIRSTVAQSEVVVSNHPGIICSTKHDGNITLLNGRLLQKFGVSTEMFENCDLDNIGRFQLLNEVAEYIRKTFILGVQDAVVKADKEVFHIRTTPIYDEDGHVTDVVAFVDDIAEITALTVFLENILNSIDSMIYVTVPATSEILFINDCMKRHFNIEGDVTGQICYKVLQGGTDQKCIYCPCYKLDRSPYKIMVWEEHNTLTNRIYRNMDKYIKWPGRDMVHLQHSVDITDMVRAKELAEQGSRTKSEFLAKMSHEIRTPMNAIIGMAEIALREKDADAVKEHVQTVRQTSSNLLAIINDILDLSKIETGKLEIFAAEYRVAALINDVINIIRMRVVDTQIRFIVNIDCNIPNTLIGDEIKIRQVLINVLGNAVKYTERGYVSLHAGFEYRGENTINLVMEITDSGRGIKQEDIALLFEDFKQVDQSKNKDVEGIGLGLAITRSMVKAMKGTIDVKSEYGKGSTFTVTIPQKFNSPQSLAAVDKPREKSVLVFERRKVCADSIVMTVENLGVSCTHVSTDLQLHEAMTGRAFDFLIFPKFMYMKNKETISSHKGNATLIILLEYADAATDIIPEHDKKVLTSPVYSVPLANILNGCSGRLIQESSGAPVVSFTAPDAKVLIVDDIITNLKVAQGLLLPYGMQVELCESGAEAIDKLKSKVYDLVFMDHKMPVMDGVETARHIRKMGDNDPYYINLPIVALTANAIAGIRDMFLENGFDDFMPKPIDTIKLNLILEKWIAKSKQVLFDTHGGVNAAKAHAEEDTDSSKMNVVIEGLDVEKGISRSGGSLELFLDTLSVFYEDGLDRIKEIAKCLESDDLPLYTIHVHGLKGAASLIGADKLSDVAYELELAGNRGDFAYIEEHNGSFIRILQEFLDNVNDVLKSVRADGPSFDEETLNRLMNELKMAVEGFDAAATHGIMESLLKLTQGLEINASIRKISDNILVSDYDEAAAQIEALIQIVSNVP